MSRTGSLTLHAHRWSLPELGMLFAAALLIGCSHDNGPTQPRMVSPPKSTSDRAPRSPAKRIERSATDRDDIRLAPIRR